MSKRSAFVTILVVVFLLATFFWMGFSAYPLLAPRISAPAQSGPTQVKMSRSDYLKLAGEIYDTLTLQYYQEVDVEKILKGQVTGLGDPYTELLTPSEAEAFREQLAGEYVGIGVIISPSDAADAIEIVRVFPDTPAEEAGLLSGDIIDSIDGVNARNLDLDAVSARVKGKAGTSVKLRIERSGTFLDVTAMRRQVELPVVESKIFEGGIGYVSVSSFSSGVAAKFVHTLRSLEDEGITGLVIDIRDNGGGYLNECLDMLSNFIREGTALWTRQAGGGLKDVPVTGSSVSYPVVVLVNENSASASEIFAAAMQENGVATIIGTTTYGKGLIQRSWNLSSGYELKVTVEEYCTPNKNVIQKKGLAPDIVVADPAPKNLGTLPEDTQLTRGIQKIREDKGAS